MRRLVLFVALVGSGLTIASDRGTPLTTDDWVFLEAGFGAIPWMTGSAACQPDRNAGQPVAAQQPDACSIGLIHREPEGREEFDRVGQLVDASGTNWALRHADAPGGLCSSGAARFRTELLRCVTPDTCVRVGFLDERCTVDESTGKADKFQVEAAWLDNVHGRLFIRTRLWCAPNCSLYETQSRFIVTEGFPTLLEVFQSYVPGPSLSFVVPQYPEGLPQTDYFDTYYGDLSTVGDWSQAQPLQCGYPATPPAPGDYLAVDDPLPDPAPGQGRYYFTAVNYQGQRRYGRKSEGGVLSGRDPAVLPACE